MSRPRRIEFPGAVFYIMSRSTDGKNIFKDDEDRRVFLDALKLLSRRYHWCLHAWVLMQDHYQLALEIPDGNLSKGMRQLNGVYTQYFNRLHKSQGPLFQGRFRSVLVEKHAYLLDICRYILLEPVRQRLTKSPDKHRWSSCRASLGHIQHPDWYSSKWLLSNFSDDAKSAVTGFRKYLGQGNGDTSPLTSVSHQALLGRPQFIAKMLPYLDGSKRPASGRIRRKALSVLFRKVDQKPRSERNDLIRTAHYEYDYTLAEIGTFLNLHYTTISKVVNGGSRKIGRGRFQ